MIAVAISMANGCLYSLVAHGATLRDPILVMRQGRLRGVYEDSTLSAWERPKWAAPS